MNCLVHPLHLGQMICFKHTDAPNLNFKPQTPKLKTQNPVVTLWSPNGNPMANPMVTLCTQWRPQLQPTSVPLGPHPTHHIFDTIFGGSNLCGTNLPVHQNVYFVHCTRSMGDHNNQPKTIFPSMKKNILCMLSTFLTFLPKSGFFVFSLVF